MNRDKLIILLFNRLCTVAKIVCVICLLPVLTVSCRVNGLKEPAPEFFKIEKLPEPYLSVVEYIAEDVVRVANIRHCSSETTIMAIDGKLLLLHGERFMLSDYDKHFDVIEDSDGYKYGVYYIHTMKNVSNMWLGHPFHFSIFFRVDSKKMIDAKSALLEVNNKTVTLSEGRLSAIEYRHDDITYELYCGM